MKRKCNWLAAILFLVLLCGCDGRQGDLLLAQAIYQEQEAQAVVSRCHDLLLLLKQSARKFNHIFTRRI